MTNLKDFHADTSGDRAVRSDFKIKKLQEKKRAITKKMKSVDFGAWARKNKPPVGVNPFKAVTHISGKKV